MMNFAPSLPRASESILISDHNETLVPDDRATLIPSPIAEAEVIDADIAKSGAHCRGRRQSCPAATLAMRYDMIPGAEPCPLHHAAQDRGRMHDTLVHQVDVRQMSRAWQMSASRSATRVFARELRARTAVEHVCRAVELTFQGFPI